MGLSPKEVSAGGHVQTTHGIAILATPSVSNFQKQPTKSPDLAGCSCPWPTEFTTSSESRMQPAQVPQTSFVANPGEALGLVLPFSLVHQNHGLKA